MSTTEVKYNRKTAAAQTKSLATSKAAPVNSDSNNYTRVSRKNKSRDGVLTDHKYQGKNTPNHHGYQSYCLLSKKAGMHVHKYKLHSSKNFFGKRSAQASVKDILGGATVNRADAVNHYQNTENKCKRELNT